MTTSVSGFSFSAFQAKYKYRISGVDDALLRSVGGLIKDDNAFKLFKNSRVTESNAIAALTASEPDPALRLAAIAKLKLSFLEKSARVLTDLSLKGETKAKMMAPALSKVGSEINAIVNDYIANTADSPADQAAFLNKVQTLIDKLQRMTISQKGKLRSEGQIYNVSIVNASRMLATAESAIATHLGGLGGSSATTSSSAGGGMTASGDAVDITV